MGSREKFTIPLTRERGSVSFRNRGPVVGNTRCIMLDTTLKRPSTYTTHCCNTGSHVYLVFGVRNDLDTSEAGNGKSMDEENRIYPSSRRTTVVLPASGNDPRSSPGMDGEFNFENLTPKMAINKSSTSTD